MVICLFLIALFVFASCTNKAEVEAAQSSLTAFFDSLAEGDYTQAANLYGGSYNALKNMNPLVPGEEHAALWEMACTVNGYQCLPVLSIESVKRISAGEYLFAVKFRDSNGEEFVMDQNCGCGMVGVGAADEFEYHVEKSNGTFLVHESPPYIP
jgi:hypothetical protein